MTKIFASYSEFFQREDKSINGVSPEFAAENPEYEKQNKSNKGCWRCSGCSGCSDCSDCSRCSGCSDCSRCSGCSDCSRCSGCSGCYGCSRCSGYKNAAPVQQDENSEAGFKVPLIEKIHQKVYEAVRDNGNKLKMSTWHTCNSTHCRAGWVVHLAGEAGYKLERQTSSLFAAMQILHKSCPDIPVSPVRFFDSDNEAMEDIKKCAEFEKEVLT